MEYVEITRAKLCPCNILECDLQAKATELHVYLSYIGYIHLDGTCLHCQVKTNRYITHHNSPHAVLIQIFHFPVLP